MELDYNKIELLKRQFNSLSKDDAPTFLSVIDHDYFEVFMSALIGYAIKNDLAFTKGLLKYYFDELDLEKNENFDFDLSQVQVELEKGMDGRRADLLIKIANSDKMDWTITIENKTNTAEHDEQTKDYQKWVNNNFKNSYNAFLYLVPDYNDSKPSSKSFKRITYSELNRIIENDDDYIIRDLKTHIKQRLEKNNMEILDNEKILIDDYFKFSTVLDELALKAKKRKNDLIDGFKTKLISEKIRVVSEGNNVDSDDLIIENIGARSVLGTSSYRLYKASWWEQRKYYLYLEIKFSNTINGPFDLITFQQTIMSYSGNSDSIVKKYYIDNRTNNNEKINRYYVLNKEEFTTESNDWNKDEWKTSFINAAVDYFENRIGECDDISVALKNLFDEKI